MKRRVRRWWNGRHDWELPVWVRVCLWILVFAALAGVHAWKKMEGL